MLKCLLPSLFFALCVICVYVVVNLHLVHYCSSLGRGMGGTNCACDWPISGADLEKEV